MREIFFIIFVTVAKKVGKGGNCFILLFFYNSRYEIFVFISPEVVLDSICQIWFKE